MKKINAIDLDKTLIPFDSFRFLLLLYLKKKRYLTPVSFYALLRKVRALKVGVFKHRVLFRIQNDKDYDELLRRVVHRVMSAIRQDIMAVIGHETDSDTINVLISASPSDYVEMVASELNWPCICSKIENGVFSHCYG